MRFYQKMTSLRISCSNHGMLYLYTIYRIHGSSLNFLSICLTPPSRFQLHPLLWMKLSSTSSTSNAKSSNRRPLTGPELRRLLLELLPIPSHGHRERRFTATGDLLLKFSIFSQAAPPHSCGARACTPLASTWFRILSSVLSCVSLAHRRERACSNSTRTRQKNLRMRRTQVRTPQVMRK